MTNVRSLTEQNHHVDSVDAEISWNFQKFLIDENGRIAEVLAPRESPLSSKVTDWLSGE